MNEPDLRKHYIYFGIYIGAVLLTFFILALVKKSSIYTSEKNEYKNKKKIKLETKEKIKI